MKGLEDVEPQGEGLICENELVTNGREEIECILTNVFGCSGGG